MSVPDISSDAARHPWWQRGIVYQIYPRSFADSDGDGVGDLRGIAAHLDYLEGLGIDAIWLSPIYPSPMADFGYDVADYCAVDPIYGTLAELDDLIAAAHRRQIKLVLDFVPNHSSDAHPWFADSRSSRESLKRDWYIWRDPAPDGGPPNNWGSHFGGGAWSYDAGSAQYYLHSFLREQPDLNWRNPDVRAAMYDVLRFWLARGVDGFRVDVLWLLIKDDRFRDNPPDPAWRPGHPSHQRLLPLFTADRPEVQTIVRELREVIDEYADRVLIGEIYLPIDRLVAYYGRDLRGAHLPFNFGLIDAEWNAAAVAQLVRRYDAAVPPDAWPNWVLGNHDKPRLATRVGTAYARIAALLLLTLRGTPTLYYGDELGMTDVALARADIRDTAEKNEPGVGLGRDPQRSPMPWNAGARGGFTSGEPWLPLGEHSATNVASQVADPGSLLTLYRRLIAVRRSFDALSIGTIDAIEARDDVLRYERRSGSVRFAIVLNFGDRPRDIAVEPGHVVLSTDLTGEGDTPGATIRLQPAHGLLLRLT